MDDRSPELPLVEIARLLHCCSRQLRAFLSQQIRSFQLSDSEFLLLWVCHRAGAEPTVQGRLVTEIGLSAAQLSGLVDRLYKRGLLRVERSDSDRRCQLLSMTSEGRSVFREAVAAFDASSPRIPQGLADLKLRQLKDLVQQLTEACSQPEESPATPAHPSQKGAAA